MTKNITDKERVRVPDIATTALSRYSINLSSVDLLNKSDGVTFRVTSRCPTSAYVLRIHNSGSEYRSSIYFQKDVIESCMIWLDALHRDSEVVVQEPVKNIDGEWVTEFPDSQSGAIIRCSLVRWIEGETISGDHTEESSRKVGVLMAKLHKHTSRWTTPDYFVRPLYDTDRFRQGLSDLRNRVGRDVLSDAFHNTFEEVISQLHGIMESLGQSQEVWGPVHGDLGWPGNVVFCGNEARPIDFNGCSIGHYLCDMAWALSYILPPFRKSFIEGYRSIRSFPDSQRNMLDCFQLGVGILLFSGWSKNRPEQLKRLSGFASGPSRMYLKGESIFASKW